MELKFCSHCVMDGSDPDIYFDEFMVCNHCLNAQRELDLIRKEAVNLEKRIKQIELEIEDKSRNEYFSEVP